MNPELQSALYAKYPLIFREHGLPMSETAMCWGLQCGNGWHDIIDHLCYAMTWTYSTGFMQGDGHISVEPPQVVFTTVKEKFGTLRIYHRLEFSEAFSALCETNADARKIRDRYESYFDGIIHMAEILSSRTCEDTGKPGEMHVSGGSRRGWYRTLNREYAKTDPKLIARSYVPVADLPKEPAAQ